MPNEYSPRAGNALPAYAFQQRFTAFEDILIRLLEISRIPRICHLGAPSCLGEEERDFFLRIAARQAGKVGEVFLVHAENIVRTGIVRRRDETGAAGREGDALLREHTLGGRVHIVSDLFRGRCDRVHGDRLLASGFADERFHDKLRHGGAADGVAFFYLILGRKKQETFFQISCSVCRCVSGGYFVVKVRGKLTRCEADKLEIVTLRFHSLSL